MTTTNRLPTDDGVELNVVVDRPSTTGREPARGEPEGQDLPAILLVNGARCAVAVWDHVIGALACHFVVVRHDVRGTGRSGTGPDEAYTFERYADDIANLCDQLGIDRCHLWGMAWGARIALVTAARHPERIDRLVLSDFAIDPADPGAQRAGAREAHAARVALGLPSFPAPDGWNAHDDPDAADRAIAATAAHPDLMPFVAQVAAPTLIVTGDHDPNLASSRRALPGFADGRLEVVEFTGHGMVRQRPDIAVDLTLAFLTD